MHKLLLLSFLVLVPVLASPVAAAKDAASFAPDKGLDLAHSFDVQRDAIVKALADGVTYKEISSGDAQNVRDSLGRISSLLGDAQSVEDLSETAKVGVFNEQEKINTLLVKAHRDSRVVCRREKPTGSHRPVNRCATVAERERAIEASQDMFRRMPTHKQAVGI